MKKFFQILSFVFCGLLIASVFVVPIVRGFLHEDEKSTAIIALLILALFVLMAVIGIRHRSKIKQRASAQTAGTIRDIRVSSFGDEYEVRFSCRFKISYKVDGREYQISRHSNIASRQAAKQYIGKTVTVHYAPDNPHVAWAECPLKP